jgi:predicted enzyme related to lactoylglutathione lyase
MRGHLAGDPVYFFFGTPDGDRAKRFFGELLRWEFSPGNAPEGHNIEGIQPPGGMFGGGDAGEGFRMYFEVDDLEVAREQVRDLGGDAGEPQPTDGGHFADCKDDQGFKFGIWAADGDQPAPRRSDSRSSPTIET